MDTTPLKTNPQRLVKHSTGSTHSPVRPARAGDLEAVNKLLRQVLAVHHEGRPDLFRASGKKYSDDELLQIFADPDTPVFVYDDGRGVLGYVFCAIKRQESGSLMPVKTLYIDDLCVDAGARGAHIGRTLFEHAKEFAWEQGCHNITLHVWECNPSARSFYDAMGMKPQYCSMEMILDL